MLVQNEKYLHTKSLCDKYEIDSNFILNGLLELVATDPICCSKTNKHIYPKNPNVNTI